MLLISFLLAVCIVESKICGELSVTKFRYHQKLNEDYDLYWNFNMSHIVFKTAVKTKGFIGFGISPNGGMVNSDVVIGWVKDGQAHFADRYAEGHYMPVTDPSQDWTLIKAKEKGEFTTLVFLRKLVTCDPKDLPITNGTSRVIYSYNPNDPTSDNAIGYHGPTRRGTKSIMLLDPKRSEMGRSLPADVTTVDFLNIKFAVAEFETYYSCTLFKLKPLGKKHHVIRVEPVIQPGHEGLVHHILLYYCRTSFDDKFVNTSYKCYEESPPGLDECMSIFATWAIGGQAFDYPDNVGYSLGAPGDPIYFRMETHYNNPSLLSGLLDNSGLRIHLTKQIRQHDAGIIETGVLVSKLHVIPPYEQSFLSIGYCTEDCIGQSLGDQEIHIFANFLHSHLLGRKLRTRHVRQGVELPPILEDNYYDFNYQQVVHLSEERILKKGDALIVECEYDTSQRTTIAYGGLSTSQEMCLSFLLYYPKISLTSCMTNTDYTYPGEFNGQNESFTLDQMDWTNSTRRASFKQYIDEAGINDYCWLSTVAHQFQGFPGRKPTITQTYLTNEC